MRSEHPESVEPNDAPEVGSVPQAGMSRGRAAAWVAMLAVGAAFVIAMLAPEPVPVPPPELSAVAVGPAVGVAEPAEVPTLGTEPEDADAVGQMAALDFTLKDMDGIDVSLASFKGQIILINFWATWCGPCKAEIPDLVELQTQYRDDLVILGISVDDTPEQMRPYAEEYGMNYPVLVGNGREDLQDAYGPLWGIPVTVIVDRDGRIHVRHSGIGSKEQFEREITTLL